jgi:hypothetical protein
MVLRQSKTLVRHDKMLLRQSKTLLRHDKMLLRQSKTLVRHDKIVLRRPLSLSGKGLGIGDHIRNSQFSIYQTGQIKKQKEGTPSEYLPSSKYIDTRF